MPELVEWIADPQVGQKPRLTILPVLQEMCRWGNKYIPDTWVAPNSFMEPLA